MRTRIKEIASRKGVTQVELANRMGVSLAFAKKLYIRGNLNISTLENVAKALECEVWQLITSEYEVITSSEGDVLTPDGTRLPMKSLRYCFDSKA